MIRWLVLCFLRLALAFAAPVAWGVALPGQGLRAVAVAGTTDPAAVDLQISATLGAGTDSLGRTALAGPGSEAPVFDADGNFQADARWTCTWDALDRLIGIETAAGVPAAVPHLRQAFTYDSVGRRIRKEVWQLSGTGPATTIPPPATPVWVKRLDRRFHYHGWDLMEVLDETLQELPGAEREALLLRFFRGLSLREVARACGRARTVRGCGSPAA